MQSWLSCWLEHVEIHVANPGRNSSIFWQNLGSFQASRHAALKAKPLVPVLDLSSVRKIRVEMNAWEFSGPHVLESFALLFFFSSEIAG